MSDRLENVDSRPKIGVLEGLNPKMGCSIKTTQKGIFFHGNTSYDVYVVKIGPGLARADE